MDVSNIAETPSLAISRRRRESLLSYSLGEKGRGALVPLGSSKNSVRFTVVVIINHLEYAG